MCESCRKEIKECEAGLFAYWDKYERSRKEGRKALVDNILYGLTQNLKELIRLEIIINDPTFQEDPLFADSKKLAERATKVILKHYKFALENLEAASKNK